MIHFEYENEQLKFQKPCKMQAIACKKILIMGKIGIFKSHYNSFYSIQKANYYYL